MRDVKPWFTVVGPFNTIDAQGRPAKGMKSQIDQECNVVGRRARGERVSWLFGEGLRG